MYCLEHYKLHDPFNSDGYGFQCKEFSYRFEDRLNEIMEFLDNGWGLIRSKYLKLKNRNNDPDKKSFILYVESVNDVCDEYEQEIYDEKGRQGYIDDI